MTLLKVVHSGLVGLIISLILSVNGQLDQPSGTSNDVATGDVIQVGVFEGGTVGVILDVSRNRTSLSVSANSLLPGLRYQAFGHVGNCSSRGPRIVTDQGIPFWVGFDTDSLGTGKGVSTHSTLIDVSTATGVSSVVVVDERSPETRLGCCDLYPPTGTTETSFQSPHPQLEATECEYGEVGEANLPFIEIPIRSIVGSSPPEVEVKVTAYRGTCTSLGSEYVMDPEIELSGWNSLRGNAIISKSEGGTIFSLGSISPRMLRPTAVVLSYNGQSGCCLLSVTPIPTSNGGGRSPPPLIITTSVPNRPISQAVPSATPSPEEGIFSPSWKLIVFVLVIVVVVIFGIVFLYCAYRKYSIRDDEPPPSPAKHNHMQQAHYVYSVSPERGSP